MGRRQASEYMNLAKKHKGTEMGKVIPISVRSAISDARPDNPNYGKPDIGRHLVAGCEWYNVWAASGFTRSAIGVARSETRFAGAHYACE
jgi:hypothetical protein